MPSGPRFHILAVEPDVERARFLKQMVRARLNAEVVIVNSADAATSKMTSDVPDVILLSAFVPPQQEAQVLSHVKAVDPDADVPLLTIPPAVNAGLPESSRSLPLSILGRRQPTWRLFDADAVTGRIEDAIKQSRSARSRRRLRLLKNTPKSEETESLSVVGSQADESVLLDAPAFRPFQHVRQDRAHRWTPAEVSWVSSVETTWGLEVRVLNISRSGILVESSLKLDHGRPTKFRLSGPDTAVIVPARIVRSEVAEVGRRGVTYQVAAVFERGLELFPESPDQLPRAPATPKALAELLLRIANEMGLGHQNPRALFEQGLKELVPAREIRICERPAMAGDAHDSVYFTVPDPRGRRMILQAIFEPNHEPGAEEFKLLKASAAAASIVLLYEGEPSQTVRIA